MHFEKPCDKYINALASWWCCWFSLCNSVVELLSVLSLSLSSLCTCVSTGHIWCPGLHSWGEDECVQADWRHNALRHHEVQTETQRGAGWCGFHWGYKSPLYFSLSFWSLIFFNLLMFSFPFFHLHLICTICTVPLFQHMWQNIVEIILICKVAHLMAVDRKSVV